jgi:hypothetical protein
VDADRFDTLARALQTSPTRRLTLAALTALGLAALLGDTGTDAKKKGGGKKGGGKKDGGKKGGKKKKKAQCKLIGRECCFDSDCSGGRTCCQRAYCGECCSQEDCEVFYPGQGLTCSERATCDDCSPEGALCSNDIECCSDYCDFPDGEAFGACGEAI